LQGKEYDNLWIAYLACVFLLKYSKMPDNLTILNVRRINYKCRTSDDFGGDPPPGVFPILDQGEPTKKAVLVPSASWETASVVFQDMCLA
jgi:hypothetical protein